MRIRSLRIKDFRKLAGPLCIDGLADGITVIAGENEEGKSTVLHAIRSVLFDRYKLSGEDADAMLPYNAAVRPEIALDFEIDGTRYALRKAFCQRQEAELTWFPDGRAQGDAAEDRLRELLCFEGARKGASKATHQGIWGLFWVEQGHSFDALAMNAGSLRTLTGVLEREVGNVVGGERGRLLLTAIAQRHATWFTPRTGKPTGAYDVAMRSVGELRRAVEALRVEKRAYDEKVERLAAARAARDACARERQAETADALATAARETVARIEQLKLAADTAAGTLEFAQGHWQAAQTLQQTRARLISEVETAHQEVGRLGDALSVAERARAPLRQAADQGRLERTAAEDAYRKAQGMFDAAELASRRARIERELAITRDALEKATAAIEAAQAAQRMAALITVDDAACARLRGLAGRCDTTRARLQAAETRVEFSLLPGHRVTVAGEAVSLATALRLTERTTLQLAGFGDITITPGGDDLHSRRADAEQADAAYLAALAGHGIADLVAAEAANIRRSELLAAAAQADAIVGAQAPAGIASLQRVLREKQGEAAELAEGAAGPALVLEAADSALAAARQWRDDCYRTLQVAADAFGQHEEKHRRADDACKQLDALHTAAAMLAEKRSALLADERAAKTDEVIAAEEFAAAEAFAAAMTIAGAARTAWEREDAEAASRALAQAEAVRLEVHRRTGELNQEIRDLESRLDETGHLGLGEALALKEGELQFAEADLARMQREAEAVKLLYQTLREAEQQARENFTAPIRQRIRPYLYALFPDSELEFARDTLEISHLHRAGKPEPFCRLSIGTREQLAVLTRLAFAELLHERGQPAAVILDDALVYADRTRLRRMQDILRRAGERLQILVLTCREDDYAGLNVPIVRLCECTPPAGVRSRLSSPC